MLTLAYLDGNLNQLLDPIIRDKFIAMLGIEKEKFKYMIDVIAKATLLNKVHNIFLAPP